MTLSSIGSLLTLDNKHVGGGKEPIKENMSTKKPNEYILNMDIFDDYKYYRSSLTHIPLDGGVVFQPIEDPHLNKIYGFLHAFLLAFYAKKRISEKTYLNLPEFYRGYFKKYEQK